MARIAVIPGDGIGVDVIAEGVKVLETLKEVRGIDLELEFFDYGAEYYLKTGQAMPPGQVEEFAKNFSAIYFGAVGDPRLPIETYGKELLFGMRWGLDLYVNLRPVKLLDTSLTPLKDMREEDINFVIVRENTEGLYAMMGGNFKKGTRDEIAIQEDINTYTGVERVIRFSFDYAKKKGLKRVAMAHKSNALYYGHGLWVRVFYEVAKDYPDIEAKDFYIDNLVMQMIKRPQQFEVIVTCNMFGDIISDLGAQMVGGLGLAPSGNINPHGTSMFEPVHGSAPKYAGKNIANPIGAILTAQMMLDHLGFAREAQMIEEAVVEALRNKMTPRELGGNLGTREVGDYICSTIRREGG